MVFYSIQTCSILLCINRFGCVLFILWWFCEQFSVALCFRYFYRLQKWIAAKTRAHGRNFDRVFIKMLFIDFLCLIFRSIDFSLYLSVCTGDRYALDCLIFRCYFRFNMVVSTEKKLLVMILIMFVVTILFILYLFSLTFAFIYTLRMSGLIVKMAYRC